MWLLSLGLILVSIYLYFKHVYSHWEKLGVPFAQPTIPFGNMRDAVLRKESIGMAFYKLYLNTKGPLLGFYNFLTPTVLICDAELARNMLVDNFASFHDRGLFANQKHDPTSSNLFGMQGNEWRNMRNKLTPAFTSGKLKGMFSKILDVGDRLDKYIEPHAEKCKIIDAKEECSRYALDIVSSVIFGVEVDTINNPNHEFRVMADSLNRPSGIEILRILFFILAPKIMAFFRITVLSKKYREFMLRFVNSTIELREKHNMTRKDVMQLLLQYRNSGEIQADGDWELKNTTGKEKTISIEEITGHASIFYIAGSETSSAAMAFCLYELAQQPKLMKLAQQEIDIILGKHNGVVTYDSLKEMKFVENCLLETFRKYPGLPMLNRECTKDFPVPGTKHVITKGTPIVISLYGIHRNPDIFPEPDKFNPDRFLNENGDLNDKLFMPFGEGPRNCVAYRMGKMVATAGVVKLLLKYNFEVVGNPDIEYDPVGFSLIPLRGLPLKVTKRGA